VRDYPLGAILQKSVHIVRIKTKLEKHILVLTRKAGQKILIGDDIVIYFLRTTEEDFRIGIDAPDDVKILREEIAGRYAGLKKESWGE